jgi:uracil-DNA glycosylase
MPDSLARLQTEIRACRRCVDAGYLTHAQPIFRGGTGQRLMILGQAPGVNAAAKGIPWSGTSGKLLRGWLERIGIDPGHWLDDCYLTSVTRCFPGPARSGSGDRMPSRAEQALCRTWLDRELAFAQPKIIVTLGRLAAETMAPHLKAQSLAGFVGVPQQVTLPHGEVTILPLPHPSGVSRWLNDPVNRRLVDAGLERLRELYTSHLSPDQAISQKASS